MRKTTLCLWVALVSLSAQPAWADEPGADALRADPAQRWSRWQGRLILGTSATPWRLGVEVPSTKLSGASLMGDYYLSRPAPGDTRLGGFRATSGLVIGPRGRLSSIQPAASTGTPFSIGTRPLGSAALPFAGDAAADTATVPYLGVGYSGLAARNRLSFNADLGLAGQGAGPAGRFGRSAGTSASLDDAVRELRLAPLVQFGVSYSF